MVENSSPIASEFYGWALKKMKSTRRPKIYKQIFASYYRYLDNQFNILPPTDIPENMLDICRLILDLFSQE